jgi:hypothetical protein
MSAPLKLNASQLGNLAEAISNATNTTRTTRVRFDGNGFLDVTVDDSTSIRVTWDDDARAYILDDLIGD